MSAIPVVKQIETKVIHRPAYNNAAIRDFGNWYRNNEPALNQYWRELGGGGDYFDFCAVQYDVEKILEENRRLTATLEREPAGCNTWQDRDADAAGVPMHGAL